MPCRRAVLAVVSAVMVVAGMVTVGVAPAAAAGQTAGAYVPVGQFRALATRSGVRAGRGVTARIAGRGGVPSTAAAVVVTVHAIAPSAAGSLTAFPAGTARPHTTNVTFARGRSVSQAAVVRLAHGGITVFNSSSGSTKIAVDVSGYYVGGSVSTSAPGLLHLFRSPVRAVDTRRSGGAYRGGQARTFRIGAGVPSAGVGAVAVMLSAVAPQGSGALIGYAAGNDRPAAPTVSFTGRSATAFAWVPTRSDGSITVANTSARTVQVVLDVVGWTNAGVAVAAGAFQPRFPDRLVNNASLGAGRTATVHVAGRGGVPLSGVRAAVVSLTAAGAQRAGALVAYRSGHLPAARSILFSAGDRASSLVEVPLNNGAFLVRNTSGGSVRLSADVVGFVPATNITAPKASLSRYLGDLTDDVSADGDLMDQHGCADAHAVTGIKSPVVLLDVGAQSIHDPLSLDNPGVSLTQTAQPVRLAYPDLRDLLNRYLVAFATCAAGQTATIAIGTNNDGDYSSTDPYSPSARGADWAGSVLNMLASQPQITVVGANDIEPGFASTQAQAQAWEYAYLNHATIKRLIFNGSADGCPDSFDATNKTCQGDFTQRGIYNLAHNSSGQIQALPQIYGPSDAAKWANIDRTGGGRIGFVGALTQHAMDSTSYSPQSGWAALRYAIGTLTASPSIPAVTDLTTG